MSRPLLLEAAQPISIYSLYIDHQSQMSSLHCLIGQTLIYILLFSSSLDLKIQQLAIHRKIWLPQISEHTPHTAHAQMHPNGRRRKEQKEKRNQVQFDCLLKDSRQMSVDSMQVKTGSCFQFQRAQASR